jgi:hypothetical protein
MKKTKKEKEIELQRVLESLSQIERLVKGTAHPSAEQYIKDLKRAQKDVWQAAVFREELRNYKRINSAMKNEGSHPPQLEGFDICGKMVPLYEIGGDNIFYIDYPKAFNWNKRIAYAEEEAKYDPRKKDLTKILNDNKYRVGVFINDVEGHQNTDAPVSWVLKSLIYTLLQWDLYEFGQFTPRVFENANMDYYRTINVDKGTTALYYEINTDGRVRSISAAHPLHMVFSYMHDRFVEIANIDGKPLESSTALGVLPSKNHFESSRYPKSKMNEPYVTNEIMLQGKGDILIAFTDGLSDYVLPSGDRYLHTMFENRMREWKDKSSKEICDLFEKDFRELNPDRGDDISYVVARKLY